MNAIVRDPLFRLIAKEVDGDIDVFAVEHRPSLFDQALLVLSVEERKRAHAYLHDDDRIGFALTRSALRNLIGGQTGASPAEVAIEQSADSAPRLSGRAKCVDLNFSVSRSHGLSLIAVSNSNRSIGIDLEFRRNVPDACDIASKLFGLDIAETLAAKPESVRCDAFLALWTAGEALTKARGIGLSDWVGPIPIAFEDGQIAVRSDAGKKWRIQPIKTPDRWIASLAFEQRTEGAFDQGNSWSNG